MNGDTAVAHQGGFDFGTMIRQMSRSRYTRPGSEFSQWYSDLREINRESRGGLQRELTEAKRQAIDTVSGVLDEAQSAANQAAGALGLPTPFDDTPAEGGAEQLVHGWFDP